MVLKRFTTKSDGMRILQFFLRPKDLMDSLSTYLCSAHRVTPTIMYFMDKIAARATTDLSGREVRFAEGALHSGMLRLGPRIANGGIAGIYLVRDICGLELEHWAGPIVAKIPLEIRGIRMAMPRALAENNLEVELYHEFIKHLDQLEAQQIFPKDPAWSRDGIPLVPILGSIETSLGRIIVKPKIIGKNLHDLALQSELTFVQKNGLKEVWEFVQAIFDSTSQWDGPLNDFGPDLRPGNFVWIDDPIFLEPLGYKRPGFILYEVGKSIRRNYYHRDHMSFEVFSDFFGRSIRMRKKAG